MHNRNSLLPGSRADDAYGLIYEGCGGSVLSICVYQSFKEVGLSAWRRVGHPLVPPGMIFARPDMVEESLAVADWVRLTRMVRHADFWALPKTGGGSGLDGWTWTIEGRKGKRYHSCRSWCASISPAFRKLGKLLVELSGLQVPRDVP